MKHGVINATTDAKMKAIDKDEDVDEHGVKCFGCLSPKAGLFWFGLFDMLILTGFFLLVFLSSAVTSFAIQISFPMIMIPCIIMFVVSLIDNTIATYTPYYALIVIKLLYFMLILPIFMIRMDNNYFVEAIC